MTMIYACLITVPTTGTTITMVAPGQFRLANTNAKAREMMHNHGYAYDRKSRLWS